MAFILSRLFAYLTFFTYLAVGVVAVRVYMPETTTIEISSSYLKYFSDPEFKKEDSSTISVPQLEFSEIKFPVEKKVVVRKPQIKKVIVDKPVIKVEKVARNLLPFKETMTVTPVVMGNQLMSNLVTLFDGFKYEQNITKVAQVNDAVNTKQSVEVEPEFFEYPVEEEKKEAKKEVEELSTNTQIAAEEVPAENVEKAVEEVAVDELISFDYSKTATDIKEEKVQKVSVVTTRPTLGAAPAATPVAASVVNAVAAVNKNAQIPVNTQKENALKAPAHGLLASKEESPGFANRVTIQVTGTDFKKTQNEVGFEVRPQDDLRESFSDYNNGQVVMDQILAEGKMTRAVTILKRGFVPTNTDVILEDGASEFTVPMIEEDAFNKMMAPFESRGAIGAVLVELDTDVEGAALDVPYSRVVKLDENMKITESSDFAYQLFVGVKAGNALLSYKDAKGETTSKVIHIHEHELTFESNFFEDVKNEKVAMVEEDLLSSEKRPLIISSEMVRQFATDKTAKKINDHTYKTQFNKILLGGRKYLELGHQDEPVFVGFKDATTLDIPSENFMRYLLSKFEGSKLGNRCLVQVNLDKKVSHFEVSAESVSDSLQTSAQVLDADGKFYDSVSDKSRKIIVVGENQGSADISQDAKINFKIEYQDGTTQYFGSYCSPNTYLVEQL